MYLNMIHLNSNAQTMKLPARSTAFRLGLIPLFLAATLFAPVTQAQTVAPPSLMSYQGYLTDGNGNPLGATNTGPKNYNVLFQIYNQQTGGTSLYAEQQTVTVDNGYFSVLLGQGAPYQSINHTLSSVFTNATSLFVELAVIGIAAGGNNAVIAPRLQLLSSPYAFLAQNATGLISPNGNILVTPANGQLTINGTLAAIGALSGNGSGLTNLSASQLTTGTVPNARLSGTYSSPLTLSSANNSFTGNGSGLNSLNAANISSGTLADSLLSGNVALRAGGNALTGNQTITSGSLGVGTTTPQAPLHVFSTGYPSALIESSSIYGTWNILHNASPGGVDWQIISTGSGNGEGAGKLLFDYGLTSSSTLGNVLALTTNGLVGIGTTTPTHAKVEISGAAGAQTGTSGYIVTSSSASSGYLTGPASLYASGNIMANAFWAYSDTRIKRIEGRSDSAHDLTTLLGIEITDYHYKDVIAKGNAPHKKVIAQQVERVFPQAVSQCTDFVPDIYQKAEIKDGWVNLATTLKTGERVRLINDKAEGGYQVLEVKVLEVTKDKFRTEGVPNADQIFVYGREVHDFRSLDYEAISMLNVSATQELAKRLEKLEVRENHLAELEQKASQVTALEQEVADLKKLVARLAESAQESKLAARPASAPQASTTAPKAFTTAGLND